MGNLCKPSAAPKKSEYKGPPIKRHSNASQISNSGGSSSQLLRGPSNESTQKLSEHAHAATDDDDDTLKDYDKLKSISLLAQSTQDLYALGGGSGGEHGFNENNETIADKEAAAALIQKQARRKAAKLRAEKERRWLVFSNLDLAAEQDMVHVARFMQILFQKAPELEALLHQENADHHDYVSAAALAKLHEEDYDHIHDDHDNNNNHNSHHNTHDKNRDKNHHDDNGNIFSPGVKTTSSHTVNSSYSATPIHASPHTSQSAIIDINRKNSSNIELMRKNSQSIDLARKNSQDFLSALRHIRESTDIHNSTAHAITPTTNTGTTVSFIEDTDATAALALNSSDLSSTTPAHETTSTSTTLGGTTTPAAIAKVSRKQKVTNTSGNTGTSLATSGGRVRSSGRSKTSGKSTGSNNSGTSEQNNNHHNNHKHRTPYWSGKDSSTTTSTIGSGNASNANDNNNVPNSRSSSISGEDEDITNSHNAKNRSKHSTTNTVRCSSKSTGSHNNNNNTDVSDSESEINSITSSRLDSATSIHSITTASEVSSSRVRKSSNRNSRNNSINKKEKLKNSTNNTDNYDGNDDNNNNNKDKDELNSSRLSNTSEGSTKSSRSAKSTKSARSKQSKRDKNAELRNIADIFSFERIALSSELEKTTTLESLIPDDEDQKMKFDLPIGGITPYTVDLLIALYKKKGKLSTESLHKILRHSFKKMKEMKNISYVQITRSFEKITVVGDIHGQLSDLLHILEESGLPSKTDKYIFNGDFVDRGEEGLEVISLLLALVCAFPGSVFLNRGNHEDFAVCCAYGFQMECRTKYDNITFGMFVQIFHHLPLFTIINHSILVVHGGLFHCTDVTLEDLNSIQRHEFTLMDLHLDATSTDAIDREKKEEFLRQLQRDALWSDPTFDAGLHLNPRGAGVGFGPDITKQFLDRNKLKFIVRSHECVQTGFDKPYKHPLGSSVSSAVSGSGMSGSNNVVSSNILSASNDSSISSDSSSGSIQNNNTSTTNNTTAANSSTTTPSTNTPTTLITTLSNKLINTNTNPYENLMCTVFSASNYSGGGNTAAYLVFSKRTHKTISLQTKQEFYFIDDTDLMYSVFYFSTNGGVDEDDNKTDVGDMPEHFGQTLYDLVLSHKALLLSEFKLIDIENTGYITKSQWAEVMQRISKLQIYWDSMFPVMVPVECIKIDEKTEMVSVAYEPFLNTFTATIYIENNLHRDSDKNNNNGRSTNDGDSSNDMNVSEIESANATNSTPSSPAINNNNITSTTSSPLESPSKLLTSTTATPLVALEQLDHIDKKDTAAFRRYQEEISTRTLQPIAENPESYIMRKSVKELERGKDDTDEDFVIESSKNDGENNKNNKHKKKKHDGNDDDDDDDDDDYINMANVDNDSEADDGSSGSDSNDDDDEDEDGSSNSDDDDGYGKYDDEDDDEEEVDAVSVSGAVVEALYSHHRLLEAVFRFFDKSGSGTITNAEFRQGCALLNESLPPESKIKEVDKIMAIMDVSDDGEIDINEFFEMFRLSDAHYHITSTTSNNSTTNRNSLSLTAVNLASTSAGSVNSTGQVSHTQNGGAITANNTTDIPGNNGGTTTTTSGTGLLLLGEKSPKHYSLQKHLQPFPDSSINNTNATDINGTPGISSSISNNSGSNNNYPASTKVGPGSLMTSMSARDGISTSVELLGIRDSRKISVDVNSTSRNNILNSTSNNNTSANELTTTTGGGNTPKLLSTNISSRDLLTNMSQSLTRTFQPPPSPAASSKLLHTSSGGTSFRAINLDTLDPNEPLPAWTRIRSSSHSQPLAIAAMNAAIAANSSNSSANASNTTGGAMSPSSPKRTLSIKRPTSVSIASGYLDNLAHGSEKGTKARTPKISYALMNSSSSSSSSSSKVAPSLVSPTAVATSTIVEAVPSAGSLSPNSRKTYVSFKEAHDDIVVHSSSRTETTTAADGNDSTITTANVEKPTTASSTA